jgi:hypothetical protein
MAAVGRILQVIGWIWLALGFFGSLINLPVDLDILPGIVLIFIARIFRAQAARRAPEESEAPTTGESQPRPSPLNTERSRSRVPPPEPTPPARPTPEPVLLEPPQPSPETKRKEMLDQILVAGTELATESSPPETGSPAEEEAPEPTRPMSSAEMIARAHERWDKRP